VTTLSSHELSSNVPTKARDSPKIALNGRKLRIVQLNDRRLFVRSAGRWGYAFWLGICCVLAAFGLWVSALWVYMAVIHPAPKTEQNIIGLVCGVPFTIFWTYTFFGMIYWLLQMALPRNTIIDLDAGQVTIRQIPGLSKQFSLADVSSVDLVMYWGHGVCHLGFTDQHTGLLRPFHWLSVSSIRPSTIGMTSSPQRANIELHQQTARIFLGKLELVAPQR
jgi:hypothetical protein